MPVCASAKRVYQPDVASSFAEADRKAANERTQSWHLSTTRTRSVDQTTNLPFCSRFHELNLHGFGCTTSERERFETGTLSKRVPHVRTRAFPLGLT